MITATVIKEEVFRNVTYNQFMSQNETFLVDIVYLSNGVRDTFSGFANEVWNSRWCSVEEAMTINKTTSLKKKTEFANKYAEQFANVPGRKF